MGSTSLTGHLKYRELAPLAHESPIAYALRCAAHLVSPPQEPGEHNEFECTDVAKKVLQLTDEIERLWRDWETHYRRERARKGRGGEGKTLAISFKKTNVGGLYKVFINGLPAGEVRREGSTAQTWWLYTCASPELAAREARREWAVRHAVLEALVRAADVKDYFAL